MMEVVLGLAKIAESKPSALTVGTFDGVHLGHRQLLQSVINIARNRELESMLVTFDPHPKAVVSTEFARRLKILTNLDEKLGIINRMGMDRVVVIKFTREFSELSYEQFIRDILVQKLRMKAIVVGHDHGFGKDRDGNIDSLNQLKSVYGFDVEEVGPYTVDGLTVSSTNIREKIKSGQLQSVTKMLGRPYTLSGIVVKGEGRGRRLTFPTANISPDNHTKLVPKVGVYAVDCRLKSGIYRGMANIGYKPTFGGETKTIEIHLFDFAEDIYGNRIEVHFLERIRDEIKFKNEQQLVKQLKIDKHKIYTL